MDSNQKKRKQKDSDDSNAVSRDFQALIPTDNLSNF